jgi:hypothetical protein
MSNTTPRFHALFPESNLPPLNTPTELFGALVVFIDYGARVLIKSEHTDEGTQVVGYIGKMGRYAVYRAATTQEAHYAYKQLAPITIPRPKRNKPRPRKPKK